MYMYVYVNGIEFARKYNLLFPYFSFMSCYRILFPLFFFLFGLYILDSQNYLEQKMSVFA